MTGVQTCALPILGREKESNGRAWQVIETLAGRCQLGEGECFLTFAKREGDNCVLVNCRNGVVKVTPDNIELMKHDLSYMFTSQVAAAYNPDACCEEFAGLVGKGLEDEKDQLVLLFFGAYALMPDCNLQLGLVCYGPGAIGKNTVWNTIESVIGSNLVQHLSMKQICSKKANVLTIIQSAALNVSSDLGLKSIDETKLLKQLVEVIDVGAQATYAEQKTFKSYSTKFVFLSKYLPNFKHGTNADFRGLRFLKFNIEQPKSDPRLETELAAEKAGIFTQWLLPCLQNLLKTNAIPEGGEASRAVNEEFSVQNDPLGEFLAERCNLDPGLQASKSDIYEAYKKWVLDNDICSHIHSDEQFFRDLKSRNPELIPSRPRVGKSRMCCMKGIALKQDLDQEEIHKASDGPAYEDGE